MITSAEPVPVQVDGEATGHTPIEIDLLPIKLPFIVPPNSAQWSVASGQ